MPKFESAFWLSTLQCYTVLIELNGNNVLKNKVTFYKQLFIWVLDLPFQKRAYSKAKCNTCNR